jgi:hypothetical protein
MPIISFAMSNRSLNTASSRDCGSSRQVVVGYLNQNLVYGGEEGRKRGTRRGEGQGHRISRNPQEFV